MSWIKADLAAGAGASNLTFNEKIKALRAQGETIHHLGFGQCPFPLPKLAVEECQKHAWRSTYAPIQGIKPLREEIIKFHQKIDGIDHFSESDVICAPGSKGMFKNKKTLKRFLVVEYGIIGPVLPAGLSSVSIKNENFRKIEFSKLERFPIGYYSF